ncbi:MAG: sensor histidine kinase [Hyphomicrobium sp.]|nr:sensor histidine kinase [Hyphomicrobium sp.]
MARTKLTLAVEREMLEQKVLERTSALEKERDRAEALLRDVTHRIGNTLSLVVGFLNLHIRHARDPEAIKTLTGARERVMAISNTQRRMNVSHDLELVRIDLLVKGVLDDLTEAQSHMNIRVISDVVPASVAAREATTLCVLIQEFVINAIKHAFPDDAAGEIRVVLQPLPTKGAVLTVSDNGVGHMPDQERSAGLGTQISGRLARQFEGHVTYASGNGLVVTVNMPGLSLIAPGAPAFAQPAGGNQRPL